jgi:membrane AbrB-like protein
VLGPIGYAAGAAVDMSRIPAPYLLAPILVGLAVALAARRPVPVPPLAHRVSQATVGVITGSYLAPTSVRTVGPLIPPMLVVTAATVAMSLFAASVLTNTAMMSRASAVLAMAPGGSAAIVSAADDVGADRQVVAFAQYLRVALVAMSAPLVVHAMQRDAQTGIAAGKGPVEFDIGPHTITGAVVLLGVVVLGQWSGRLLRLPAASLLGPMLLTALVAVTGLTHDFAPAGLVRDLVFTVVGLDVGLRFTRASLTHVGRLLGPVVLITVMLIGNCAAIAWWVAAAMHVPFMDAYLATTPGGINAVLATAVTTDANVGLVSSVQSLRLFVIVLLAPFFIRLCARSRRGPGHDAP